MQFTAETRGVLEMQNFSPAYKKGLDVQTYVGAILSEPKFLGCIDNQLFSPMVLRSARSKNSPVSN